jgi:hypothetical protein
MSRWLHCKSLSDTIICAITRPTDPPAPIIVIFTFAP